MELAESLQGGHVGLGTERLAPESLDGGRDSELRDGCADGEGEGKCYQNRAAPELPREERQHRACRHAVEVEAAKDRSDDLPGELG